jgi:DNA polymerase-1
MIACIDIETDRLVNPSIIWLVVAKDLTRGTTHVFRDVQTEGKREFLAFWRTVDTYVGHNWLEYDYPVICRLLGADFELREPAVQSVDTLVLSRLADYTRSQTTDVDGTGPAVISAKSRHSVAAYGEQFGFPKLDFTDFSQYSASMEEYCVRDVLITEKIYNLHRKYAETYKDALRLEQEFQFYVVNALQNNGFAFNKPKAEKLLEKVQKELGDLDGHILREYPDHTVRIREVHPRVTRYGTLNKGDFRFVVGGDLSEYNGYPFSRLKWVQFNPSSHRQVIDVLHSAGWSPTDKTAAHIDYDRSRQKDLDKGIHLGIYGWKINENNLSTLPSGAPEPARLLAKRILLESRRRTLTEWLSLVQDDGRIHGRFFGIGAWTHRMSHQNPNTANIPNDLDTQGKKKLLGKELRSLWCAPKNRLLVGVDAEGIQLRVFAHLIDDKEFTDALVNGRKENKTDPHSLNQRILGRVCKSRAAAKRFIYALLLGAGIWKLAQILECSEQETREALDRLLLRYSGWKSLKETVIPQDGLRGWFVGLDGRRIKIPGATKSERSHLAMSGYLQSGEAIIMKLASLKFIHRLKDDKAYLVNMVHDEWQTEVSNNIKLAREVADYQSQALVDAGRQLKLKCPLAGSYWNDDIKDYTIGTNWSQTH